jgi:Bacterial regulatory proteins, gntR family
VLPEENRDLYHVAGDPQLAEALMTPREATQAAAVAAKERAAIIGGEYGNSEQDRAPSRAALAKKHKISLENASVVLRMLAAEGWVTLAQGRGTFIRPRRLFRVDAVIGRPEGIPWGGGEQLRADEAVAEAARRDEAVRTAVAGTSRSGAAVSLDVIAVSPARAQLIAEGVIWSARTEAWSWDGWDLAGASVTARPA